MAGPRLRIRARTGWRPGAERDGAGWEQETRAIRTQAARSEHREHAVPLFLTSSFVFDDAEEMRSAFASEIDRNLYSRFTNPNVTEFIDKLCQMEGAQAGYATATGMAAVYASFAALLQSDDHIVSGRAVFGSTHTIFTRILPRFRIDHSYVDLAADIGTWEAAITDRTRMLYVETPTNPGMEIADLDALGALARDRGLMLVVDNTLATPVLQQPIRHGADLCVHSATKLIDGQGRVMGGAVVGREDLVEDVYAFCRSTGPALSPFNAWVLSKSMETLSLRVERHCRSALALAEHLEGHPEVERARYPFLASHPQHGIARRQMSGGRGLLAFTLEGDVARGRRFLDAIRLCSLTANLGDSRTIVTHPASTTHAKLSEAERQAVGITPGLVRVSVGLEGIDDIADDIDQALAASV